MTNDRRPLRDPARVQRLQREPDPRVRHSLTAALLGAALAIGVGLGVTALRVQQVELAYRLDAVRAERARAERLIQQLEVELATLRSPGRVESRARQLGLLVPTRGQVRLAREYVPASPDTIAARAAGGRIAAAGVVPGSPDAGSVRVADEGSTPSPGGGVLVR